MFCWGAFHKKREKKVMIWLHTQTKTHDSEWRHWYGHILTQHVSNAGGMHTHKQGNLWVTWLTHPWTWENYTQGGVCLMQKMLEMSSFMSQSQTHHQMGQHSYLNGKILIGQHIQLTILHLNMSYLYFEWQNLPMCNSYNFYYDFYKWSKFNPYKSIIH